MRLLNYYSFCHVVLWKKGGIIRYYDMYFLSFEFLDEDFDYIILLNFDSYNNLKNLNINDVIISLEKIYNAHKNTFILLTPRKAAPLYGMSVDEDVNSFSCSFDNFRKLIERFKEGLLPMKSLLFELVDQILIGDCQIERLLVRQIPIKSSEIINVAPCDVIIPHRGSNSHLNKLLFMLDKIKNLDVHIGMDQLISSEIYNLTNSYPKHNYYSFEPNPIGPYVIRNWLIDHCSHDYIIFQDSDDIPCSDRFEKLVDYVINTGCELCGSHEILLDYFERTVIAVRYPLNVKSSLDAWPNHSLLHPSSCMLRNSFYYCGRLSEERIFANDTKFLFYNYFRLNNILNIDEFLYFRRKRPNSLTTSGIKVSGYESRGLLLEQWVNDFNLVKSGEIKLEESSLCYKGPRHHFRVSNLKKN